MTYRDPYPDETTRVPDTGYVPPERAADAGAVAPDRPAVRETIVRDTVERPVAYPAAEHAHHDVVVGPGPSSTVRQIVWLLFGVLQALIVIRVVLLLLGANEGNDIVSFVLGVTDPFVEPFRGMFRLDSVSGASGSVLDIAAIVALIAWTLVEALVLGIVGLADRRTTVA